MNGESKPRVGSKEGRLVEFPLKQTALAGFCMVRRQPGVFAAWVVIELAQRLIDSQLRWMTQSGTPVAAIVDSLVAVALSIPFGAVLWLAVYRAFLRPGEARFSYLRLGRVELRMAGVLLLVAVAEATLSTIVLVGLTLRDTPLPSPKLLLPVLGVVSLLATIAAVRFMLIPAILVDQNRLSFRQSWRR